MVLLLFIFDLDGTLIDTWNLFTSAFDDAADRFGFLRFDHTQETHIRALTAFQVLRYHQMPLRQLLPTLRLLRQGMQIRRSQAKPFPGVLPVLNRLIANGHQLAIVSSNSRAVAGAALGESLQLFQSCAFEVPLLRKDAALKRAVAKSSTRNQACFVGDEIRDFQAAQTIGLRFIAVAWGYNTEASLRKSGACEVIEAPAELLTLSET